VKDERLPIITMGRHVAVKKGSMNPHRSKRFKMKIYLRTTPFGIVSFFHSVFLFILSVTLLQFVLITWIASNVTAKVFF
jgi:hypothetical protein